MKTTNKQGTQGAPKGNTNAVRHGLASSKLPKRLHFAERRVNQFRKIVEEHVIAAKGEITLVDASAINSAMRWERHAILCGYWLNKEIANLTPDQKVKYSEAAAKASDARDKHIRALGLDQSQTPIWANAITSESPA